MALLRCIVAALAATGGYANVLTIPIHNANVLTIPIHKVPDEQHAANLLASHTPPRYVSASTAIVANGRKLIRTGGARKSHHHMENVVLRDLKNAQYYGKMGVGTPAQEFQVVFDTGSADMWVPSQACKDKSTNCAAKTAFDSSASSSYSEVGKGAKSKFQIQYGSGPVSGTYGVEKVTLADDYVAEKQTFALVDSTDGLGDVFKMGKFDGVLGLAFNIISKNPSAKTILPNLKEQNVLDKAMFAFFLGDNTNGIGGEMAIGGYNEERIQNKEEIKWIDLISPAYWLVPMDKVRYGNDLISIGKIAGIMDTGTSLIYGPATVVSPLALSLGAQFIPSAGLFLIDCNATISDLEFTFGRDKAITIPGSKLKMRDDSGKYCLFGIAIMQFAADEEDVTVRTGGGYRHHVGGGTPTLPIPTEYHGKTWLMGDWFLRMFYSIYDYDNERFGIADLRDDNNNNLE